MPRWTHIAFCVIWVFFITAFAILAYQAHKSQSTTLTRVSGEAPEGVAILRPGDPSAVDIGQAFNVILAVNNKNVDLLESSIRESASIAFILNLSSCFMAALGFTAQATVYCNERRKSHSEHSPDHASPQDAPQKDASERMDKDSQKEDNADRKEP
jgi:hypothetical protein